MSQLFSRRYITRSVLSRLEQEMIRAIENIGGKVVVKMKGMIIVEFEHKLGSSGRTVEIVPFKLVKNSLKVIYSDIPKYNKNIYFRTRYGNNKELFQKVENFLKVYA